MGILNVKNDYTSSSNMPGVGRDERYLLGNMNAMLEEIVNQNVENAKFLRGMSRKLEEGIDRMEDASMGDAGNGGIDREWLTELRDEIRKELDTIKIPETQMSALDTEQLSAKMAEQITGKIVSQQMAEQLSQQVSAGVAKQVSADVSKEITKQMSGQMTFQMSEQVSKQVSVEVSRQMAKQLNGQLLPQVTQQMEQLVTQQMTGQLAKFLSNELEQLVTQTLSQQISVQMTEQLKQVSVQFAPNQEQQYPQQYENAVPEQYSQQVVYDEGKLSEIDSKLARVTTLPSMMKNLIESTNEVTVKKIEQVVADQNTKSYFELQAMKKLVSITLWVSLIAAGLAILNFLS